MTRFIVMLTRKNNTHTRRTMNAPTAHQALARVLSNHKGPSVFVFAVVQGPLGCGFSAWTMRDGQWFAMQESSHPEAGLPGGPSIPTNDDF